MLTQDFLGLSKKEKKYYNFGIYKLLCRYFSGHERSNCATCSA